MNSRNFFQTQGGKTAPLKFTLFDQFCSFLPTVVALVFTVIFIEKKQKKNKNKTKNNTIALANWTNPKTTASLKIFWLFAQKPRLHLTQPIGHIFFQKYDINTQNIS